MISDATLLNKISGAMLKLADADFKLCQVFTDPIISESDRLHLKRAINHIAESRMDTSQTLPPPP